MKYIINKFNLEEKYICYYINGFMYIRFLYNYCGEVLLSRSLFFICIFN